jgi:hypothetical protein
MSRSFVGEDSCAADLMANLFIKGAENFRRVEDYSPISLVRATTINLQCISGG